MENKTQSPTEIMQELIEEYRNHKIPRLIQLAINKDENELIWIDYFMKTANVSNMITLSIRISNLQQAIEMGKKEIQ